MTKYTVKQLADLAGVSVRTLHYYDEIALLRPSHVGDNGYRYYRHDALLRLQQILFFRELDFSLEEIGRMMEMPGYGLLSALYVHRASLVAKIGRLNRLIKTIDGTIHHLKGEFEMSEKQLFSGFSEEEKRYAQEARQRWGKEEVNASHQRWNAHTQNQKERIRLEGQEIYLDLANLIRKDPGGKEVQAVIGRWHQHLRQFYEPTPERLRGLGDLYNTHPEFRQLYTSIHPDLPAFMREAIEIYCSTLEQE